MEARALAGARLDPDAPAVALDHLLADGQADAGSRVLALVMQALEHHEDALVVLRLDADAVVAHFEVPLGIISSNTNMYPRDRARTELQRIAHQVLQELRELRLVGVHGRHGVMGHHSPRL